MAPPLVLFDIDGTLLWGASPAHAEAFASALADLYGAPNPFDHDSNGGAISLAGQGFAGRLDAEIARWCLEAAGVPAARHDAEIGGYCEAVGRSYLEAAGGGGYVLPGVVEVLEGLAAAAVPCGLVTGNLEVIARRKLESVGLVHYFARQGRLVGGFGAPPARRRSQLVGRAREAAAAAGADFDEIVYVGDTPFDAHAAREAGVRFVGVATGRPAAGDLIATGAGPVLADLSRPDALAVILGR